MVYLIRANDTTPGACLDLRFQFWNKFGILTSLLEFFQKPSQSFESLVADLKHPCAFKDSNKKMTTTRTR